MWKCVVCWFALALACGGRSVAEDGPARPTSVSLQLEGPVRAQLDGVIHNWLVQAPRANPAMLAMFADRDQEPRRDLLPWSGEFAGKYLTGATEVLNLTNDEALARVLTEFVAEFVALQADNGYLGPFAKEHQLTGSAVNVGGSGGPTWDAWGHYHAMLGLLLWHERTGDAASLAAARRIGELFCERFLGEKRPRLVDTGSTEMNLAPIHGLCLLSKRTHEPRYLALAKQLLDEFAAQSPEGVPLAGDYFRRGLAGEPFYKLPKPRWESLHPVQALAELHRIEGNADYKTAFSNLWWSIVELDRHNNGGFSSGEQAQGNPYHQGAIETCCTIAWMAMCVDMLNLTGDVRVADELELSTLNSVLGMFTPSGRWSTYNTPMDGTRKANFHDIVFQARPGSPELNCCSVNAARGFGILARWGAQQSERGLLVNWYGPGTMRWNQASGPAVTFKLETEYPRSGRVQIEVSLDKPAEFALQLRIPHWSTQTEVRVNGMSVAERAPEPGRYFTLRRVWKNGDRVTLDLDLSLHAWVGERESEGRASLFRGPILLAYDSRFNPGLGDDPPSLDLKNLKATTQREASEDGTLVRVDVTSESGRTIRLVDFARAGVTGTAYRTWLRATGLSPAAFDRERPWRTVPLPAPR